MSFSCSRRAVNARSHDWAYSQIMLQIMLQIMIIRRARARAGERRAARRRNAGIGPRAGARSSIKTLVHLQHTLV